VSAAGDVLVGDAVFADPNAFSGFRNGAFRWTAAGGFQSLGALEPGFFSVATDVSADGSTVVGQGGIQIVVGNSSTNGSRAFRWTSATGMVAIGPMAGHTHAIATGVSDNGQVVVGISSQGILGYSLVGGNGTGTAFRWTQAGGIQDLRQLLVNAGLNLTGVTLVAATAISGDGQWIVGNAVTPTTPAGETRPFIAKYCDPAISGTCTPLGSGAAASFALATTSSTTLNVVAGASATSTLTVTPTGGFNQAVTFTCSGLPTASSCAFAPSSLTPNAAAISTTLTITTTAPSRAVGFVWSPFGGMLAVAFGIAWLLLLHAVFAVEAMRARTRSIRSIAAVCGVVVLFASCGGGGGDGATDPAPLTGGTPAGTYPVTVTATSGTGASALSRTLTVTLAVAR
jgi:uncharacterized membrane protein